MRNEIKKNGRERESERGGKMDDSHRQSDGDGVESRFSAEITHQESRIRRR